MMISHPSRKQLTVWGKLRQRKHRHRYGLFLAEGERCVNQILENGIVGVEAVLQAEGAVWSDPATLPGSVQRYELVPSDFQRIAGTETPQGIAAVCQIPQEASPGQLPEESHLIVALDAVQDPGNVGTMLRTATWFGASAVICGSGTVDPWHPKVVRSTAGATGVLPILSGDLQKLLLQLEDRGWEVRLLDGGPEATEMKSVKVPERVVLVVGNEGRGVAQELFTRGRQSVRIGGQSDRVESLNAAVALSIALYEHYEPIR